ncbi:RnfABCDGE type electron transport complex subunit D [Halomonas sp. V046]|uniref:RnfABCDGE type electron transport complex subunit D n=1 Tax=Halomonas sp. V046 TaxID=3459611 RepID=UPI0040441F06
MSLLHQSHTPSRRPGHSSAVMRITLLACLPGIATQAWFFGWGVVTNVLTAALAAAAMEALVLLARRRHLTPLKDHSALLTGVLLGAALPAGTSVWLILIGIFAAIVVAKHLYGGLGHNLFNPAMVGYALLLVSFPVAMSLWPSPQGLFGPDALAHLAQRWLGQAPPTTLDALSGATPLDALRHRPSSLAPDELIGAGLLSQDSLVAWRAIAGAWLVGGCVLLWRGVIGWRIPLSVLASMALTAAALGLVDAHQGSVLFHLTTGASVFGAFFIATDPVSAASGPRARLAYAAGIGSLVIIIRAYGAYPDALAFAVLLMNLAAPLLDQVMTPTRPTATRPGGRP